MSEEREIPEEQGPEGFVFGFGQPISSKVPEIQMTDWELFLNICFLTLLIAASIGLGFWLNRPAFFDSWLDRLFPQLAKLCGR